MSADRNAAGATDPVAPEPREPRVRLWDRQTSGGITLGALVLAEVLCTSVLVVAVVAAL